MTYVYLFGGILAVLLAVVIGAALRERGADDEDAASLETRRDAALEALREVEFDFRTGKLAEDEYRALRRKYGRRALEARAALEGRTASKGGEAAPVDGPREDGRPVGEDVCTRCGAALPPRDRFCSRCGAERTREERG